MTSNWVLIIFFPGHNVQQHSVVLVRGGRSQDCPGVRYHLVRGSNDLVGYILFFSCVIFSSGRTALTGVAREEYLIESAADQSTGRRSPKRQLRSWTFGFIRRSLLCQERVATARYTLVDAWRGEHLNELES
jgi:hypothetical protein